MNPEACSYITSGRKHVVLVVRESGKLTEPPLECYCGAPYHPLYLQAPPEIVTQALGSGRNLGRNSGLWVWTGLKPRTGVGMGVATAGDIKNKTTTLLKCGARTGLKHGAWMGLTCGAKTVVEHGAWTDLGMYMGLYLDSGMYMVLDLDISMDISLDMLPCFWPVDGALKQDTGHFLSLPMNIVLQKKFYFGFI